jgi:molybdopterin-guanine dinucleotide biosynthesis protein A
MIQRQQITGVILAGGKSSRMGFCDKALIRLGGTPLIEHVIRNSSNQVGQLVISANRNPGKFEYLELPLIPDIKQAYAGPLVGILSAMYWMISAGKSPDSTYLACFPADVPWFPDTLIKQLTRALETQCKRVAWSEGRGQTQPLFSLWSLETLPVIEQAVANGQFGPKLIMPLIDNVLVKFKNTDHRHFLNINTKKSLQVAENFTET